MRLSFRLLYLSATAILVTAGLLTAGKMFALPALDLGGMKDAVTMLRQQEEVRIQLEEQFRLITERGLAKKAVLNDLFAGRSDLRSAVARYQVQCGKGDWRSLESAYGDNHTSRDDLVARHLIYLSSQWAPAAPAQRIEVEQRLKAEWARLRGEKVGQDV
jgi:hypothetical protein